MSESKKINAWVAVDADGSEFIFNEKPKRLKRNTATKYIEPRIQKTTQSHKNLPRAVKI